MSDYPGGFEPPTTPPGPPPFDPGSAFVGLPPDGSFAPAPQGRRSGRWIQVGLGVAIVGMLAGIGVIAFGPSSNANANAILTDAATSAIGDKTAKIQISETIGVAGQSFTFSGSGVADFSSGAMQLSLSGTIAGQSADLMVVSIGGTTYVNLPQAAQLDGGKPWLSIDASSLGQSAASGVPGTGENPAGILQALAQGGYDVNSLGSSTVDGQQVQGYSVALTPGMLDGALNNSSIPSAAKQALQSLSGSINVFVAGSGDLVRLAVDASIGVAGQTVNENVGMDLSDYGTPVTVSAPPADQTESFQDFLQAASNAGQT